MRETIIEKTISLINEIDKKVIEREELVRLMVLSIFSKSHIFLIGPPGVGKTYIINIVNSEGKTVYNYI